MSEHIIKRIPQRNAHSFFTLCLILSVCYCVQVPLKGKARSEHPYTLAQMYSYIYLPGTVHSNQHVSYSKWLEVATEQIFVCSPMAGYYNVVSKYYQYN